MSRGKAAPPRRKRVTLRDFYEGGLPKKGKRMVARPASPQDTFSEFRGLDRKMRGRMRDFHALRKALRIRRLTDANLKRLRRRWRASPSKRRSLSRLIKLKKDYRASLWGSALMRWLVRHRLLRDAKFIRVENLAAFTHNMFGILKSCRAARQPCSMALVDLDFFGKVNKRFGHEAGDVVINELAHLLSGLAKKYKGAACRFGGEEFRVFVPISAEELSRELLNVNKAFSESVGNPREFGVEPTSSWRGWKPLTFSAGVSGGGGQGHKAGLGEIVTALATETDKALKAAKRHRNEVWLYPSAVGRRPYKAK